MNALRREKSASAITLLEEVFRTAKALPLAAWAVYYGATLPLVLTFLYFWADMANHAFAHERLAIGATALSVLFVAAKTGHVLFAHQVLASVTGDIERPRPRLIGVAMNQAIIQSTGLLLLPLALFVVAPFGWLYAAYQNASALDDGKIGLRDLINESRKQAGFNSAQSNVMLWLICPYGVPLAGVFFLLIMPIMRMVSPVWTDAIMGVYSLLLVVLLIPLCPFGLIVAVNIGATLMMIPQLFKMIFGIDTDFSISPAGALNPTFFIIVCGMTYLCLDPLVKIAYTLRCFYGDSVRTGKDLRIKIESIARRGAVLLAVIAGCLTSLGSQAQETAERGDEIAALDRAIETTLHDSRFAWRMPRQRPETADNSTIKAIIDSLSDAARWIDNKTRAFRKWLRSLLDRPDKDAAGNGDAAAQALRVAASALLAALLAVLAYMAWKTWRRTTVVETIPIEARAQAPDLEDENTTADALASAEWLKLAAELMARGEVRLAMRAYFFAGLARLAQLRLIRIVASKSNREYIRELRRVDHARGELVSAFHANVRVFESVWYGDHGLAPRELQSYVQAMEGISACE